MTVIALTPVVVVVQLYSVDGHFLSISSVLFAFMDCKSLHTQEVTQLFLFLAVGSPWLRFVNFVRERLTFVG